MSKKLSLMSHKEMQQYCKHILWILLIVHELIPSFDLTSLRRQNIICIFSDLRVSNFKKGVMGCLNLYLLPKTDVFYRPELTREGTTWKWILTIFEYKNVTNSQIRKSRWKKGFICLVSMFSCWVMVPTSSPEQF